MSNKHTIIQLRRGTEAEWAASDPQPGGEVLKLGEPGYEKDTKRLKIGDGITPWNSLPYVSGGAVIDEESIQDLLGNSGFLIAGTDISLDYDDDGNTLTINNTKETFDAAVPWTANHTLVDGTRYLAGDLVYENGRLYRANFDNESLPVSNTTYWTDVGPGYRLNIDGRDVPNIPYPVQDIIAGSGISVIGSSGNFTITSTSTGGGGYADEARSLITTVFNNTGSPIPKFSVVYISGGQGDMPTISLASASGEITSSKTYGITAESIGDMTTGKVIVFGALTGVNTDQFNPTAPTGNVNGITLWLSPSTPGGVTTTKPSAPNHMVAVGTIVRTHQNEGVVEVKIQNGFELEELHNVAISGISDNQILIYSSGNSLWSNKTLINNPLNNRLLTSNASGTIDAEPYFRFDDISKTTNVISPVTDGDTGPWYIAVSYGDSDSLAKAGRFVGRRFRGTEESPLPAQSGDTLVVFRGDSPNASGSVVSAGRILMRAEGNAEVGYAAIPSRIEISTSSGPGISDNSLILYSTGHLYHDGYMTIDNGLSSPTPIYSLGAVSGNTAISYAVDRQIQTLTLGGTAVNFTKGTGWNVANRSYDVILHITVTSTTSVAFDGSFITDFFSTLPTFSAGTYIVLIRNFGASNIHCYYIGKKA